MPGQGPSCPVPGGWRVLLATGDVFTHGPDREAPEHAHAGLDATPADPACVEDAADHAGLIIYARPSDVASRYATIAPQLRDLMRTANGRLREEAAEHGWRADYEMRCSAGVLVVRDEVLPTSSAADSFSTIVNDLRARGYTSTLTKHWVFYDGSVGAGIAGQGSLYDDDRLVADNRNNAAPGTTSSFAVSYNTLSSRVWMHESGHNLGAVQLSAPHSSGNFHCNDGLDVMCYADGGPNSTYTATRCTDREHFDCGHDSYFRPGAPAGSYLATRWNLGSTLNRFIRLAPLSNVAPTADFTWSCPTRTCTFDASPTTDPDSAVASHAWSFGDGAIATGIAVAHTFPAGGTFAVTLTATDVYGAAGVRTRDVIVPADATPPVTSHAFAGTAGVAPWYRSAVTVTLSATDDDSGVARTEYRIDGGAVTAYAAPFAVSSEALHTVEYRSRDVAGNVEAWRSAPLGIDTTPPAVAIREPRAGRAYVHGVTSVETGLPYAVFLDAATAPAFRVRVDVVDALSGGRDVRVLAGPFGTSPQCSDAVGPAPAFACDWRRDLGPERSLNRLVAVGRDLAGNEAEADVETLG